MIDLSILDDATIWVAVSFLFLLYLYLNQLNLKYQIILIKK